MHNRGRYPKKTVMIVDDEEPIRRLLRSLLKVHGYRVLLANTSTHALRICARFKRPIDLVITDVQMPELSGFDLAGLIAGKRPEMPILFISGAFSEHDPDIRDQLSAGRDFLAKPFTAKSLALKVESMLAESRDFVRAVPDSTALPNQWVSA